MSTASLSKGQLAIRTLVKVVGLFTAATFLRAQETPSDQPRFPTPDKKWELRVVNNTAVLVSAGSTTSAIALSEEGDNLRTETAKLVWAPDSKRFALNYRSGGKYHACDLYELTGANWKKLPSLVDGAKPVDGIIKRALARELKRIRSKNGPMNSVMTVWGVSRWIENDTFEAHVSDQRRVNVSKAKDEAEDWEYFGTAVRFTGKCDNRGGWKVIASHELSDAETDNFFKNK